MTIQEKLNSLEKENSVMAESITFVQELLEEVHPSEYYEQVKRLKDQLKKMKVRYRALEIENADLLHELDQLRAKNIIYERRESDASSGDERGIFRRVSGLQLFQRKGSREV